VPRTLEGVELTVADLEEQIARSNRRLADLGIDAGKITASESPVARGWMLVLARPWVRWRRQQQWRRLLGKGDAKSRRESRRLHDLLAEREGLQRQLQSVEAARRLLALWHLFHVPLGGVLFTLAFIHIAAALYYGTLLK
jgi:hypothetical protein